MLSELEDRSGIESLIASLYLSSDWAEYLLMPLTAYFDASGHQEDQKYLVVAGFVASGKDWIDFDRAWQERLGKDGIKYFHAADFAHSFKQFDGWRDDHKRRNEFSADLMNIIKSHTFRQFGTIIINKALNDEMPQEVKDEWLINSYSLAGRAAAGKLRQWLLRERWETVPELIFEDGDIGKGLLRKALLRDGFMEPLFKPKKDRNTKDGMIQKGLTPLQAADWLAYEMFLCTKTKNIERWPLKQFILTPGFDKIGIISPSDLKTLQAMLTTPRDQIVEATLTADGWMWD